jgi:hypothetical protein
MERRDDAPGADGAARLIAAILGAFDAAVDEGRFSVASEILGIADGLLAGWPAASDAAARRALTEQLAAARSRLN